MVELSLHLGVLAPIEPLLATQAAEAITVPHCPTFDHLKDLSVPDIDAERCAILVADGHSGGGWA